MIKKIVFVLILIYVCGFTYLTAFGDTVDTLVNQQFDLINLDELDKETKEIINDSDTLIHFDFKDTVMKIIKGELKLSFGKIADYVFRLLFNEIYTLFSLIQKLIIIAVLSAILKNLNSSFNGKAVGELSFYICYIVLIFIILASFSTGAELVSSTTDKMVTSMQVMLPVFTTLMFTSGSYTQMAVIGPIIMSAAGLISMLIKTAALPAITLITTLEMLNHISEKSILSKLTDLMKSITGWCLKGSAMLFMAVISLEKIGTPALNRVLGKTTKAAVGAIPIVGDVMTGAVEAAAALTGVVKNGVAAGAIIFIVIICMLPLIKLVAMILIYKFTAALIEPICEARIVKCISAAGDFTVLLLGALFTVEIMFIFSVIIMLSTA